jgi:hypothetical protein
MTRAAHSAPQLSYLALLCACAILLAWAAPVMSAVADEWPDLWPLPRNHSLSDLTVELSEATDVTDDPVLLSFSKRPALHSLISRLHAVPLIKQIWSPTPPVRPPDIHA